MSLKWEWGFETIPHRIEPHGLKWTETLVIITDTIVPRRFSKPFLHFEQSCKWSMFTDWSPELRNYGLSVRSFEKCIQITGGLRIPQTKNKVGTKSGELSLLGKIFPCRDWKFHLENFLWRETSAKNARLTNWPRAITTSNHRLSLVWGQNSLYWVVGKTKAWPTTHYAQCLTSCCPFELAISLLLPRDGVLS